jgi:hypothetical protein
MRSPPDPETANAPAKGRSQASYQRSAQSQARPALRQEQITRRADVQLHWLREAHRLARLFLLTSERRHFRALIRHLHGMHARQNEGRGHNPHRYSNFRGKNPHPQNRTQNRTQNRQI